MCEQINDVPEKKSLLEKLGVKKSKELPFTAEKCWCETKYGIGVYKLPAERVRISKRVSRQLLNQSLRQLLTMLVLTVQVIIALLILKKI